jgi:K+-transporting ATPase KdpF subunit
MPAGRGAGIEVMSFMEWAALVLSAAIGVYLVAALLYPEKFQ